ncbi:MAG: hypothetical protein CMF04_04470 [Hyphomonas sp.]|nr:hypothetical protein [Hyphomonas sp.]
MNIAVVIRRIGKLLIWLVIADLAATLLFWGVTRLSDQTAKTSGGLGVVFYTDNAADASARIDKGISLLQKKKLDRLLMVGGHRPQDGRLGSQEMALLAARRSGLSGRISADVESRDTISGLSNLAKRADTLESGKVVFISNCMHVLRAKAIYSSHKGKQPKALGACPSGGYNPLDIWRRAHYEAAAWMLFLLPEGARDAIIDTLRGDEGMD